MHCLVEIGRVIFDSKYFHFIDVFSLFRYHLLLEKALHLKDALLQGWLKLSRWFWRRSKCEKFTPMTTPTTTTSPTTTIDNGQTWLRWAKNHCVCFSSACLQTNFAERKCNLWKNNWRKYSVKLISIEWNDQNQQLTCTTLKWQMNFLNLKVTCRYTLYTPLSCSITCIFSFYRKNSRIR